MGCDLDVGQKFVCSERDCVYLLLLEGCALVLLLVLEETNLIVHTCVCIAYVHGCPFNAFGTDVAGGTKGSQV